VYKKSFLLLLLFLPSFAAAGVRTGLDALLEAKAPTLKGKRIGLIVNQTSRTSSGEYGPDLFLKLKDLSLVALFSPEHGIEGLRRAGANSDTVEKYKGVPIYSLYGSTRKPTPAMLRGIEVLIFDIQDIGVRPYTYLSTMILAMEAAAENKVEFIVLDRPNPLGGERIEGNIIDSALKSFVGQLPIPYIHGMTLGELAMMARGERWFKSADKLTLSVIQLKGWSRSMTWDETGLTWTPPSPNIPTFESAVGTAMFGAIGELGVLSIGIGSDKPFLRLGSRLVNGDTLLLFAESALPKQVEVKRQDFTVPYADSTKTYTGLEITLPKSIKSISRLYGPEFELFSDLLTNALFKHSFDALTMSTKIMFEKVTGTERVVNALAENYRGNVATITMVISNWKKDETDFRAKRKKYLLYK
jgi:uncharacterized protein YbbC (DUF1343 family)